jgi:predicted nuclease of restriction endonuclease-like RecB superfamily
VARRLVAPETAPSPREVSLLYNLALLQGLLRSSEAARVHVRAHVRAVVRYAKLLRLICTYHVDREGTRIHLSGPLSLFRMTTKYGHAIASFLPSVVATPGWSLEARCVIRDRPVRFRASHADPIASTNALPSDADSALERALCRDFRRLGSPWTLARETAAIPTPGGGVFFPDFTLSRGDVRILVELVGFYTPEYLTSKLAALRAARQHRVIVLIDESLACDSGEITASAVIRYRKRVDAAALLGAANHLYPCDASHGVG